MVVQRIISFLYRTVPALAFLRRDAKMDQLLVRCVEGDEFMSISYSYSDKQSNMLRSQMETAEKSLSRLANNVRKLGRPKKKNKKMKCEQTSDATNQSAEDNYIVCSLFVNGSKVGSDVLNKDAWVEGAILHLGMAKYRVCRNMPTILSLKLPNCILVGCPIYPRVEFEFIKTDACTYTWYREVRQELGGTSHVSIGPSQTFSLTSGEASAESVPMETNASETAIQIPVIINPSLSSQIKGYEKHWVEISSEKVYMPQASELGGHLKLVCTPSDGERLGSAKEVVTMCEVKMAPDAFPFEKRHQYTKDKTSDNCFRVVSYNILADMYADSDFSRDVLYPYCPKDVLDIDYREQLLLKELTGYNADIMCLQEVGRKLFESSMEPSLKNSGLDGLLRCKHGNLAEGEAIFYRTDKFRLLGSHDVAFCEVLQKDPLHRNLLEAVARSDAMLKRFLGLAAVVQVAVFELISDPSKRLCIANTHLYFHPRASHIRLIQTAMITQHIQKVCSVYQEQDNQVKPAVVLCGDLNSTPDGCVYEFLVKGSLSEKSVDWYSSGKEEFCGGVALTHSLNFQDACQDIAYTNLVAGFRGKLDHIMFEGDKMKVDRVIPMSTHQEVTRHVALPNAVFPSDHLSLVCELSWK
ncbi:2',5'-phosphodiesterase 12-like [Acanthaster planci]|uniref:2',5'-phosphodiesterase 12 n=1 Tax=Acanthaster planci TaxID=133434 RepID=A0A8B7ZEU9_ACAPL|nr:2',5'-phosphodiesterase 12-like [Acanthaster planci]